MFSVKSQLTHYGRRYYAVLDGEDIHKYQQAYNTANEAQEAVDRYNDIYSDEPLKVREGVKIVTVYDFPPIPDRNYDWCAYEEGQEERMHYGHGKTKEAAIQDLLENYGEEDGLTEQEAVKEMKEKIELIEN